MCESPSGAGALYTVPGVAEANASSVPVIALTSGIDLASEYKGVITELDHHMLYKTITKWSTFMKRYDKIPDTLRRAFRVATTGRPGAVHIAFPQEVLNAEIPGGEEDDLRGRRLPLLSHVPGPLRAIRGGAGGRVAGGGREAGDRSRGRGHQRPRLGTS